MVDQTYDDFVSSLSVFFKVNPEVTDALGNNTKLSLDPIFWESYVITLGLVTLVVLVVDLGVNCLNGRVNVHAANKQLTVNDDSIGAFGRIFVFRLQRHLRSGPE